MSPNRFCSFNNMDIASSSTSQRHFSSLKNTYSMSYHTYGLHIDRYATMFPESPTSPSPFNVPSSGVFPQARRNSDVSSSVFIPYRGTGVRDRY
uniref:Uncharacterized protein n=1 Tax=Cajanus cajan TaxID=3821 RepID=A0A151U5H5_CAJCA|nr:hypothetical protein KK1_007240 [Cajanus cajan]